MVKVLYVTNLPAPYRIDFLTLLAQRVDLTVLYERKSAQNRDNKWVAQNTERPFREIYLDGKTFGEENTVSLGIVRHLRQNTYDEIVLSNYNSPAVMLAISYLKRKKLPFWINCDGMLPKPASGRIKEGLKRRLISSASGWISTGKVTSQELIRYGADPARIHVCPFSSIHESEVLPAPPDRDAAKRRLGLADETVLLYVGQFIHRKGLDLLIPAFETLCAAQKDRKLRLLLVGGKPEQLQDLGIGRLPDGVRCVPFLTKKELAAYYAAADLFVLPTREDIWGLVVNEAMAFGLPVVTTDRCGAGLTMLEDGRTGCLIPTQDAAALADGMKRGLTLSDSNAILDVARSYTLEAMAKGTLAALNADASASPNRT